MNPDDLALAKELGALLSSKGALAGYAIAAGKWFISDWFKKSKEIEATRTKTLNESIDNLKELVKELKATVGIHSDKLNQIDTKLVETMIRVGERADVLHALSQAIPGFVASTNKRLEMVEQQTTQVIHIGKELVMLKSKKAGS